MSNRYQFKPTTEDKVVLSGSVWNKVAWVLNWIQGISVAAPLQMSDVPGGPMLSLRASAASRLWVTVGGSEAGLGMYYGFELTLSSDDIDPANDVTLAMIGTSDTESILIVNEKERGSTASAPFLSAGGAYPATWSQAKSTDGRRVALIRADDPEICTPP